MANHNMQNYDSECKNFCWDVPDRFNFGRDVIDKFAVDRSKVALFWEDKNGNTDTFTFWDIKNLSNQTGNMLCRLGVNKGDRVLVLLPRVPAWQISMVACFKIGAVPIPGTEMLTPKDIEYRITNSETTAIITNEENIWKLEEIKNNCPTLRHLICIDGTGRDNWLNWQQSIAQESRKLEAADTNAEDPGMMFYTSGTTGDPKGVVVPQKGIYAWRYQSYYWHDVKPHDVMWATADTGWSKAGTGILIGPWSWGTPVFFYNGPFEPKKRLELLEKYEISIFCAAPTEIRYLIKEDMQSYDLGGLRHVVTAGEALNPEELSRFQELTGLQIFDGYGLTEALMVIHNYPCMKIKIGSIGKPLPGYSVAVIDEEGKILPPGQEGDLVIQRDNPNIFSFYWQEPEKTRERFVGGWFITGDRGMVDEEGYFWFRGRGDDIISSAGYRIGPSEVENALSMHPAVIEAAAVGSPDPTRGEIVKAFVVLDSGYSPSHELAQELKEHTKVITAPYKYPRQIDFVESLPKTISGKIKRKELKLAEYSKKGV